MKNKLSDLIDIEKVSELLEGFNKSTGFVTSILDLEGNILSKSGWRKICTEFHRVHPKTSERCKISDTILANKIEKSEKYRTYTCLNGLTDVAVPLEINGQHVANLFSGQFFFEKPDIAFFKKQAKKYGFDEKEYVEALGKVPVVSEEKSKTIMNFLLQMTSLISELGFEKTKQVELNKRLRKNEEELKAVNQQLEAQNQQLQASEQKFRSYIENSPHGIFITDDKGGYVEVNEAAGKITGYSKDELLKMNLIDLIPVKEHKKGEEHFKTVIKTGESVGDLQFFKKDGSSGYWTVSAIKLNKNRFLGFVTDITERKKTEQTLKEREKQLSNIFENATGLFYSHTADHQLTYLSPQVENILGYTVEEAMNKWTEFVSDNPRNEIGFQNTVKAIETGERQPTYELELIRKDGTKIIVEVRESPLVENGKTVAIVGSLVDITEHKQAEEKMRFLSAITENMHDSIMVTDLQGNITYINKSTEKLFRYTQDELAGKSTGFLNIDSRAEEIEGELYETVSKGEVYQGEALNQRKDGSQFICEFTVAPLTDENGVISSYIGIQRDITEIRNLENAAIKQERLSAIGELASGVAHDFNNALQIILGGVEMALASEEPEELNQYLESIKHSAGDAASRVRRLQRFSQKRQPKKESVPININNLAEDVIKETKLLLNQFQKKGIHLEIKSDYKARSNIEGNEGELRSCLFNLVKNSTEAMPEGGKITVSTDEYDNKVYVSVSDTGTGMDKETQKKIFQPFYSTKGFEPGRGLGMTQVYSAIRDHNGDIYIKESEIGKGTVIEFAIPVSKKELIPEKKEEDYVGTARILWVDDEEMIRKICRKMLKKLGHTGDFAANGKEALEFLAKGNKYDLIITDIGMPGMSGWQLAEQIKDKGYAKKIAVVTGWGAEVFQEEKNRYNVGYVLGKPINLKKLKALIGEVLQMKNLSE